MSEAQEPILVAGAGIGGLTAALVLARDGHDVVVIERRTRVDEIGAGLQISPNASRILLSLGLGPALSRAGFEPERLVVRRARDAVKLGGMELGPAMRERYGAPYLVAHRADLQMLLLDKVRSNPRIRLVFGRELIEASSDATSATATTQASSGREHWRGRVLIGADGLWSKTTAAVGGQSTPDFSGAIAWRGLVEMDAVPPPLRRPETNLWLGPGAHVVTYPIRGGKTLNVVAVTDDRTDQPGWSRPGDPGTLKDRLKHWVSDVHHLLSAVPDWQVWSLYDQMSRSWVKGRIALLGDAAHPVLPFLAQGAALAIEDAVVLADEIGRAPLDPAGALRRYEEQRRPRALRVQNAARANARAYHMGFPFALARDAMMRRLGAEGLRDRYDWLYGWKHPARETGPDKPAPFR